MNATGEVRRSSSVGCAGLSEDEFAAAVECPTYRRVVGVLTADQTSPGVARELFCLEAASVGTAARVR
jgi:hypothetical protein